MEVTNVTTLQPLRSSFETFRRYLRFEDTFCSDKHRIVGTGHVYVLGPQSGFLLITTLIRRSVLQRPHSWRYSLVGQIKHCHCVSRQCVAPLFQNGGEIASGQGRGNEIKPSFSWIHSGTEFYSVSKEYDRSNEYRINNMLECIINDIHQVDHKTTWGSQCQCKSSHIYVH